MKTRAFLFAIAIIASVANVRAQSIWTSADVKYKITKQLGVFVEGEYRTNDGISATHRWDVATGLSYSIIKPLKLSASYLYIQQRVGTSTTKKGNIVPAYWQPKHRFVADISYSYDWNRFSFSLRERYQYTYRVGQSVPKFDDDGVTPKDDEIISSLSKHVLRSRIGVEYSIRGTNFKPFATCEFYNGLSNGFKHDKTRYTVGSEYKINRHNAVELFYRYIDSKDDDDEMGHVIGLGYTFKF